ncbi:hypothetical protein ABZP36_007961 [Zizania latifolia]
MQPVPLPFPRRLSREKLVCPRRLAEQAGDGAAILPLRPPCEQATTEPYAPPRSPRDPRRI